MRLAVMAIIVIPLLLSGCTNRQLARSMVSQASTVMDIQYQMVLDNIAMIECNPSALPWHVRINDGVVQVNDQGGIAGLGVQWGASPNFTRGPQASRSVTEQWGADAVTNPRIVKKLQDVYREVAGLPPDPDPLFFQFRLDAQSSNEPHRDRNKAITDNDTGQEELPPGKLAASDKSYAGPGHAENQDASDEKSKQAITWPEFEIPTGWFHVGHKCDVPHNACYVGSHCDCYVWVTRDGLADFSRFSLIILAITSTQTRDIANHQLTFTR